MTASASAEPTASWRAARDAADPGPHLCDPWIAYRAAQGLEPCWITVRRESSEAAAAGVVYLRRPRWRPWSRPLARCDLLPRLTAAERARLAGEPAAAHTRLARGLIELACAEGWASLEIESFDGPSPPPDLSSLGCATRGRFEFLLDLRGAGEARFLALKASHRRKIRDAERGGISVGEESGAAAVELLRELQGHTRQRRSERGEEMHLPDEEQYRRLAATFVAGGGARLFVARREGRALSVVLCGVAGGGATGGVSAGGGAGSGGGRAYYFMGGTSPDGLECNAAALALWRASVLLAERGIATLNLGGVPREAEQDSHPQHGLLRFKEGFGGTRVECTSGVWTRSAPA